MALGERRIPGAGAAGCKLSDTAGGEAGKAAGREAGGADDAMDVGGDEAGGEADGKAAADQGRADQCGAGTASGCEAHGEAGGAGGACTPNFRRLRRGRSRPRRPWPQVPVS